MKNSASNPTPTHTIPLAAVILPSIASRASDQSWILLTCFMPMLRHRLPVELKITVKTISTAVRVRSPGCDIVSRYAPAPGRAPSLAYFRRSARSRRKSIVSPVSRRRSSAFQSASRTIRHTTRGRK